jgi:hypothetical protein
MNEREADLLVEPGCDAPPRVEPDDRSFADRPFSFRLRDWRRPDPDGRRDLATAA